MQKLRPEPASNLPDRRERRLAGHGMRWGSIAACAHGMRGSAPPAPAHRAIVEQMVAVARARYSTGGPLGDFSRAELERVRVDADIEREHGMIDEARVKLNGLLARPLEARLGPPRWTEVRTVALTPARRRDRGLGEPGDRHGGPHGKGGAAQAADREATVPMFSVGFDNARGGPWRKSAGSRCKRHRRTRPTPPRSRPACSALSEARSSEEPGTGWPCPSVASAYPRLRRARNGRR
jgi:hypothetical protein